MTTRWVYVVKHIDSCYDCPHFWRHPQANNAPFCTELGELLNIPNQVAESVQPIKPAIPDRCPLQEVRDGERVSGATA
jgi:hypothetical protein